jgi:hypothetical protein
MSADVVDVEIKVDTGPDWCAFSEHSIDVYTKLEGLQMPYMMDYEVINLGEYNLDSVFQLVMYQGDPR